jgi:Ca-activated chloride channel family protein
MLVANVRVVGQRWCIRPLWIALAVVILITAAVGQSSVPNQSPVPVPSANTPPAMQAPAQSQTAQPVPNPSIVEEPTSPDAAPQEPGAQEPSANDQGSMFVFKREVEEVVLHATVYDERRHIVSSLDRSAFTVLENGAPQTITSFRREDVPVAIGIVIDNSSSMRDKRDKINQAVLNLIHASNPQDEVFVVNFGDNPYLDQDFTSDVNLLQVALHKTTTRGSTALYDAVVASSAHLNKDAHLEKKVLLVITDGQDNMSRETLQEASRRLQQANGPTLYAIGLLGSGLAARGRDALQSLADGTGGVAYFPETLGQVDNLTRTIAHDIRSQYMIAYRPKNQNGKPSYQSVQVEAHAPGYGKLTVRTRSGYYNPESPQGRQAH